MSIESDHLLKFYAATAPMSDPKMYAALFDDLPKDISSLCRVVQGLIIHIFWAERYGIKLSSERQVEVQIRPVARELKRIIELDPDPIHKARRLENKLVGNCRDFSLMLTAILRYQGVPARTRCGFGTYFLSDHYEDHWVAEYWNTTQNRWVLVDAQLDQFQCEQLNIEFDPLDVPRDKFIVGGKAWQMCRSGLTDPNAFGIFDMHGLWFIRGDFVRDIAALNKVELLPWDSWGLILSEDRDLTEDDLNLLDSLAELTSGDIFSSEIVRSIYENDERLRVPLTITTYLDGGAKKIELADEFFI